MPAFGRLNEFDPVKDRWQSYVLRLNAYFKANDIDDEDKQKAILLTCIGSVAFDKICDAVLPEEPDAKSLAELLTLLNTHFNPAPSRAIARRRFYERCRLPGESVETFLTELRRLSKHCAFNTYLDDMICDRLMMGVNNTRIQNRLFEEGDFDLARGTALALALEKADNDTRELTNGHEEKEKPVNYIQGKQEHVSRHSSKKKTRGSKSKPSQDEKKQFRACHRCTQHDHKSTECPFIKSTCYACQREGHIGKACLNKPVQHKQLARAHHLSNITHETSPEYAQTTHIYRMSSESIPPPPISFSFTVNNHCIEFELDTGSAVSLIPVNAFAKIATVDSIDKSTLNLASFTGQAVNLLGVATVTVSHMQKSKSLPIYVYEGEGPKLCGRAWMQELGILEALKLNKIIDSHNSENGHQLEDVLRKHQEVFKPELGKLREIKVKLHIKPDVKPRYFKARPLPYGKKTIVEDELDRLERLGIIVPVPHSPYAAPIVVVSKPNNTIRICGDFTLTANASIDAEKYPLPKSEEIFASLANCKYFSRLDMADAYNQLELEESSRKLVTINTCKGLYQYTRLPFGVSSASAIFQRNMEMVLRSQKGVIPFQDDILIGGPSVEEHLHCLDSVLESLKKAGLRLRREKCKFLQTTLDFLGHRLDAEGLHPQHAKVTAIKEAPSPRNVDELRSFLGMVNYYAKFVKANADRLTPLYKLLQNGIAWEWNAQHEKAFQATKDILASPQVLVHYDSTKPIHLACDASPVGISAVLSHMVNNTDERPIAYASRTLTKAECNYSQIDKEALSIVFGVLKFREYLLGHKFVLITDHQPLVHIFSEHKLIPATASARLQRWALTLSAYEYVIKHKKGAAHANADALSRLPIQGPDIGPQIPMEYVLTINAINQGPISTTEIRVETFKDPILQQVRNFLLNQWPRSVDKEVQPYFLIRNDLTLLDNIILLGNKVVVPAMLQPDILRELHSSHQGIVQTKALARTKIWWPNINKNIEEIIRKCHICQVNAPMPKAVYNKWPTPTAPWQRIHVDFAGPYEQRYLLIFSDPLTKWLEVDVTNTTSSSAVIDNLRRHMARLGVMSTLVSDNGTCFTSDEFQQFLKNNGVRHLLTAPYHPASNGQAERAVRTVKRTLTKLNGGTNETVDAVNIGLEIHSEGPLEARLARFLINYRRTPQISGHSPSELMFGRPIRTKLDLIHPRKNSAQLINSAAHTPLLRQFQVKDSVFARNFRRGEKWEKGQVTKHIGNAMYEIQTKDGLVRKHANQIRKAACMQANPEMPQTKTVPATQQPLHDHGLPHSTSFEVIGKTAPQPGVSHQLVTSEAQNQLDNQVQPGINETDQQLQPEANKTMNNASAMTETPATIILRKDCLPLETSVINQPTDLTRRNPSRTKKIPARYQ